MGDGRGYRTCIKYLGGRFIFYVTGVLYRRLNYRHKYKSAILQCATARSYPCSYRIIFSFCELYHNTSTYQAVRAKRSRGIKLL